MKKKIGFCYIKEPTTWAKIWQFAANIEDTYAKFGI